MNVEEIGRLVRAEPFLPFRVCLSDGSAYEVKHPDFVLLSRTVIDIGVGGTGNGRIAESIVRIAPLHIVKIETVQPA